MIGSRLSNSSDKDSSPAPDELTLGTLHLADAERRMRKVLESLGGHAHPNQITQASTAQQQPSTPAKWRTYRSGAAAKEVAVTVVRRERSLTSSDRQSAPVGLVNRLEAAEAALKAERASRNELEKSLAEAKARIRDLQTQLAHAELAHQEVLAAMRAEGEAAQDLIRDLRAHLRAVEDAQQAAPDAKKIERVALREPRRPSALNGTPTVT